MLVPKNENWGVKVRGEKKREKRRKEMGNGKKKKKGEKWRRDEKVKSGKSGEKTWKKKWRVKRGKKRKVNKGETGKKEKREKHAVKNQKSTKGKSKSETWKKAKRETTVHREFKFNQSMNANSEKIYGGGERMPAERYNYYRDLLQVQISTMEICYGNYEITKLHRFRTKIIAPRSHLTQSTSRAKAGQQQSHYTHARRLQILLSNNNKGTTTPRQ